MKIPIRNIYFLLCYAWDKLQEGSLVDVNPDDVKELHDLLARIICRETRRLLGQGLDRSYVSRSDAIPAVRGRVDITGSLRRSGGADSRIHCEFDELAIDVLHNQIIRTTLELLLGIRDLARENKRIIRELLPRFAEVSRIKVTSRTFRRVSLHRNIAAYRPVIDVCELIHGNIMIEPNSGTMKLRQFTGSRHQMSNLFERFIFHFLRREQRTYRVAGEHLTWFDADVSHDNYALLPLLKPDIVLRGPDRIVVVDAKYYTKPFQVNRERVTIWSAHLYQLLAYVRNIGVASDMPVAGMLIYPAIGERPLLRYRLQGHDVSIAFVNLDQPWREIHSNLLSFVRSA